MLEPALESAAPPRPSEDRARSRVDLALLAIGLALGGVAVWQLRQPWAIAERPPALWWLLGAAALLGGAALARIERWLPDAAPAPRPARTGNDGRRLLGMLCLATAALLGLWVVAELWPDYRVWGGTVSHWVAALALVVGGARLLGTVGEPASPLAARRDAADRERTVTRWVEGLAVAALTALAIFLRVWRIDEIPSGIYVDETNGALDALYLLEGSGASPFATGWYETPMGYAYYMAALFHAAGATHASLKAASLIPAILTVPALYPLARLLFGPLAAIAATFLLATSRWHLSMSRWGWNEVAPPLFQILATFFLLRGLRDRRATDYALGGAIAGLMVYTYLSSRLALATLGVFGLVWLLWAPEGLRAAWRRSARGLFLYLFAAVLAMAPLAVTYVTDPFTFLNRVSEISIFNEVREQDSYQPLVENVRRHLRFFHQQGDPSGKHNLPGEPETDPVTGVLFVVGLGYGLIRFRDRRRVLLWLWLVLAMIGGVFSVLHESPQAYRTLNAVPAVALLGGDVLARAARALARAVSRRSARRAGLAAGAALLAAALGAAGLWETSVYFGRQARSPAVRGSFNLMESGVSREVLAALDRGTDVYLSPRFYAFSPLRFLVYGKVKEATGENTLDRPPYRLARPDADLPFPAHGGDVLLLLDAYYWHVRDHFLGVYPSAALELVADEEGRPLYLRVEIARAEVEALHGLAARFTTTAGAVDARIVDRVEESWRGRDVVAAEWSGGLRVEATAEYAPSIEGGLEVWVDGERWTGPAVLGRGLHHLRAVQADCRAAASARLDWRASSGDTPPIEGALFRVGPPENGLLAEYFPNDRWEGPPLYRQITPFVLLSWPDAELLPPVFTARFTGALEIPVAGRHAFRVFADDGARLTIDGRVVADDLTPNQLTTLRAALELDAGRHPVALDYLQTGGGSALELYWQPPGSAELPVPPSALAAAP